MTDDSQARPGQASHLFIRTSLHFGHFSLFVPELAKKKITRKSTCQQSSFPSPIFFAAEKGFLFCS